jgi:hypothetical protein
MVNPTPHDPRDELPEDQVVKQTRPQIRALGPNWPTYVFGGVAAVLVLLGILWAASTDNPNQQAAENQPRVEGPADRSPSPPTTPAPPPSPSP